MKFARSKSNALMDVQGYRLSVSAKTAWVFVSVTTSDGAVGWGEATHFGSERSLGDLISGLAASLRDAPAAGANDLLTRLRQAEMSAPRRALCSALEQACLDVAVRVSGSRIVDQLGGACRGAVPFYANINRGITDRSATGFALQAKRVRALTGANAVKIAPFDGLRWQYTPPKEQRHLLDLGLSRVAAVRETLPKDGLLLVDCHARFDPYLARQLMRELGQLGVFWVEEPCDMLQLAPVEQRALRCAANDSGMRLAGAETIASLKEMVDVITAGGHDVVLPDLRFTGIANGMAMLRLAADMNVAASLHNPAGPVLDAISTQVAAALPSFLILERQVGESELFDKLRGSEVSVVDGEVALPNAPGFGFVPDLSICVQLSSEGVAHPLSFAGMAGAGPDA